MYLTRRAFFLPPLCSVTSFGLSCPLYKRIHTDINTHTHSTRVNPIELKCWQVISYFIQGISCHPLVQHCVRSRFVCICGTNILLIQCCECCCCCWCYFGFIFIFVFVVCYYFVRNADVAMRWSYHFVFLFNPFLFVDVVVQCLSLYIEKKSSRFLLVDFCWDFR